MRMTKNASKSVAALALTGWLGCDATHAAAWCELTAYAVDAYDHTGVYLNGLLAGQNASWIVLCGTSGGTTDCNSTATDRRLAVALSAQAQGKRLMLYFDALASCAAYTPYTRVTGIRIEP